MNGRVRLIGLAMVTVACGGGSLRAQILSVTWRNIQAPPTYPFVCVHNMLAPVLGALGPTNAAAATLGNSPYSGMVLAARAAEARRAIAVETFHAQRGLPRFQYLLGLRYLAGDGLDRDPKAARFWLAQAAARGDVNATRALASLATEKTRDQRR